MMTITGVIQMNSSYAHCPDESMQETRDDCPWAEITRKLIESSQLESDFKKLSPEIFNQIKLDQKKSFVFNFWGKSINFDELMQKETVKAEILDVLFAALGTEKREDRVCHAGAIHTYGYLFSNLKTSFGYKRARWVKDDIEAGFGLKRGTLGPKPKHGSLLQNITYFAGKVAFQNNPILMSELDRLNADDDLKKWKPKNTIRLIESVVLNENRKIELITDFVPFTHEKKSNSLLLVYSVNDSALPHPKLVTVFPVTEGFQQGALKNLGEKQEVKPRYNAHVPELTLGLHKPLLGTRKKIEL